MAYYYAKLNDDNVVTGVFAVDAKELLDPEGNEVESKGAKFLSDIHGEGKWLRTCKETRGGIHRSGGTPLRGNFCGKGWLYDPSLDVFHQRQPFPSWTLNGTTGTWVSPVPYPEVEIIEGEMPPRFSWNEDDQKWDEVEMP